MSLSMPTISSPWSPKNRAASAPIRPAEPVITATAISPAFSFQDNLELSAVLAKPREDVVDYVADRTSRAPPSCCRHRRIVCDIIWDVDRIGFRLRADSQALTGVFRANLSKLCQRYAARGTAPHIIGFSSMGGHLRNLVPDQSVKVVDVQHVANL